MGVLLHVATGPVVARRPILLSPQPGSVLPVLWASEDRSLKSTPSMAPRSTPAATGPTPTADVKPRQLASPLVTLSKAELPPPPSLDVSSNVDDEAVQRPHKRRARSTKHGHAQSAHGRPEMATLVLPDALKPH